MTEKEFVEGLVDALSDDNGVFLENLFRLVGYAAIGSLVINLAGDLLDFLSGRG